MYTGILSVTVTVTIQCIYATEIHSELSELKQVGSQSTTTRLHVHVQTCVKHKANMKHLESA